MRLDLKQLGQYFGRLVLRFQILFLPILDNPGSQSKVVNSEIGGIPKCNIHRTSTLTEIKCLIVH